MMGMCLLLAALAMLFAASVVGYWTIRSQHQPWPPPGFPVLPRTLWLSTLLIVSASVAIGRALSAARRGQRRHAAGPGNLVPARHGFSGIANDGLVAGRRPDYPSLRKHGALLEAILRAHRPARRPRAGRASDAGCRIARAFGGRYTSDRHSGIRYSAVYWHFSDAVWCVLFVVVYLV